MRCIRSDYFALSGLAGLFAAYYDGQCPSSADNAPSGLAG